MKYIVSFSAILAAAAATPGPITGGDIEMWTPPDHEDFRGPCPMLNTLANHGFLPHDGKNLTHDRVVAALNEGLNFDKTLGGIMFSQALPANPEPNATWFDLDQLNRHNVLEHDASLSRSDDYFGNNHLFNQTIFDQSTKYWTEPLLTAEMLGNSKVARQLESKSTNPTYRFTSSTENFSIGEILAPFIAFGDLDTVTVNRTLVKYFFENERLPTKYGWTTREDEVTLLGILKMMKIFSDASSLLTGDRKNETQPEEGAHRASRRGLHGF